MESIDQTLTAFTLQGLPNDYDVVSAFFFDGQLPAGFFQGIGTEANLMYHLRPAFLPSRLRI
jgi:hypothetical protein